MLKHGTVTVPCNMAGLMGQATDRLCFDGMMLGQCIVECLKQDDKDQYTTNKGRWCSMTKGAAALQSQYVDAAD